MRTGRYDQGARSSLGSEPVGHTAKVASQLPTGLKTAAIVLMATAVPIVSLLWASGVARAEVAHRAQAGLEATSKATVLQEQQAWDDAVLVIISAAARPVPLLAIQSRDTQLAQQSAQNILITGPFADVRLVDRSGTRVGFAALPGVTPTPEMATNPRGPTLGVPISVGVRVARQVAVPLGAGEGAGLVVDVDMTELLGQPSDLAFGRTGAKFLVAPTGMILAGSTAVGTLLRANENLAIAAAGKPATKIIFSPFFGRMTAESYQPVPRQNLGILVQQARSEVMGGADRLAMHLRMAALAIGVLGAIVAGFLGVFMSRRSRRLATIEQQLADSHAKSRRRLEQFLDAIPIGVFVAATGGEPYYANHEAVRLLGQGIVPGVRVEDLADVYHAYVAGTDDQYPAAAMPIVRALNGETSHADDMEIGGPDGRFPIDIWGTPVLAGDGAVEFGIVAFADASERHRASRDAVFLSGIAANMSEGVVLIRADDFTIAYANTSSEAIFGYQADELVGRSMRDLTDPEFVASDGLVPICDAVRATGAWRGEVECVREDGSAIWCGVSVAVIDHPVFGVAWIAVMSDISAHRQAQSAQAHLASIVQASRDAILAKTLDGIVTSWNSGAESLFGYSADEMLGSPIDTLVPVGARDEEADLRDRVARGVRIEQFDTVRIRKDGTAVDVSVTLSPLLDTDGVISGIATICRDVTERNRAEASLKDREDELAAARDDALEASRLKSDFLANMSHEIRTPMNAVIGLTGLLLDSPLNNEQHEYAYAVRSAGEALLEIINDILDFSKIEAGMLRLELMDFDLRSVLEEVVDLLGAEAREKGLKIDTQVQSDAPRRVRGDAGRLRQILINLVGNAVKFTDDGVIVIRVEATGETPGVTGLRFAVTDTGMGISPEGQRQLFKGFEQVDSSPSRRHGGTGLGLAISKQLVELMGGAIGVDSSLGAGSTFWFSIELPVKDGPAEVVVPRLDLHGLRVLVVAADGSNRTILGHQLTSLTILPALTGSGTEALSLLRTAANFSEPFDIALLDLSVPVLEGLILARAVSIDPDLTATRIVMLTSSEDLGGANPGDAPGLAACLPAPVDDVQLRDCLARVMGTVIEGPVRQEPERSLRADVSGGGARLLVAEDNAVNQLVATRMLERLGYRADVVANGAEAVDALMRIDYAGVLMDCQMPEMDGFEATREIRRRQKPSKRTPVIAMTAGATESDRKRCFGADMDDYIAKPVRMAELGAVLARWVPAASRSREPSDLSAAVD